MHITKGQMQMYINGSAKELISQNKAYDGAKFTNTYFTTSSQSLKIIQ